MNTSNLVIGAAVVVLLGVGGWFVFANQAPAPEIMMEDTSDAMMEADANIEGEVMMKEDGAMMEP